MERGGGRAALPARRGARLRRRALLVGRPRSRVVVAAATRRARRYGSCLWDGAGVPKDRVEALRFFHLAAIHGDVQSMRQLARSYQHGYEPVSRDRAEAGRLYRAAAALGCKTSRIVVARYFPEPPTDAAEG